MENIRKEETTTTKTILLPYIRILTKIKRIDSIFMEEFDVVANDPLLLSLSAFKIRLRYHLFQGPTPNLHTSPKPFSGLTAPSGRSPPVSSGDRSCFLRTCSVACSSQSPWQPAQCAEHRRDAITVCVSELECNKITLKFI